MPPPRARLRVKRQALDDVLRVVLHELLQSNLRVGPSQGDALEIVDANIELTNPRIRLSRTEARGNVFSGLGELLWYLAGTDDVNFIEYYIPGYNRFSEANGRVWGAYGPRLFNQRGEDQISKVISLLRARPDTRRAVIQLFNSDDLGPELTNNRYKDIPCTCLMQFLLRRDYLIMYVTMRSNDAYVGLPHDIFCFTMIQEIVAKTLGAKLGPYIHTVGSLHLYARDVEKAQSYLKEGWQEPKAMPQMPNADPWPEISRLLQIEYQLRNADQSHISPPESEYWADFARLLRIYQLTRGTHPVATKRTPTSSLREVVQLKHKMSTNVYDEYIRRRENRLKTIYHEQPDLPHL